MKVRLLATWDPDSKILLATLIRPTCHMEWWQGFATVLPAYGSDLANRNKLPKCHHSMQYVGWLDVSGVGQIWNVAILLFRSHWQSTNSAILVWWCVVVEPLETFLLILLLLLKTITTSVFSGIYIHNDFVLSASSMKTFLVNSMAQVVQTNINTLNYYLLHTNFSFSVPAHTPPWGHQCLFPKNKR